MKRIKVVKAPSQRPSRMPQQSQLLLKALSGLEEGMSVRLKCADRGEAFRTSKALMRFIYDAKKSGKINGKFSVLRRKAENVDYWFVFVVKKPN